MECEFVYFSSVLLESHNSADYKAYTLHILLNHSIYQIYIEVHAIVTTLYVEEPLYIFDKVTFLYISFRNQIFVYNSKLTKMIIYVS